MISIKKAKKRIESKREYEFCPRCNADITMQKGFEGTYPYWICAGCGEMLINPKVETSSDIVWICDKCGGMLNLQQGFDESRDTWKCTECGCANSLNKKEIYLSEDEYQRELDNPYRGLANYEALELSGYVDIRHIDDRAGIILVKSHDDGKFYIKKLLRAYDKSIYEFLRDNPVSHMPRIKKIFESDNCLIIIEEYIEGETLEKLLSREAFSDERAVITAGKICDILKELHNRKKPIIHRDIKPANIIITEAGEIYLLDMNAAKWYDLDEKDDTRYIGTMNYAAPEQAGYGLSASSVKTDIYAVGMLLNVMITGKFPKEERAAGKLWDIIERCISLEAEKRYTADELSKALSEYVR
ncbi:MAG: protein kinase [Lachnospiraceae bacterium]|nr:protein kinase [Lachnospiraceae bacterium]